MKAHDAGMTVLGAEAVYTPYTPEMARLQQEAERRSYSNSGNKGLEIVTLVLFIGGILAAMTAFAVWQGRMFEKEFLGEKK